MIISTNGRATLSGFTNLLSETTEWLNSDAKRRTNYYVKRTWAQLEDDVKEVLEEASVGTPFEGTIEKVSGQKFPDIIANKYFGVEVKSSKKEKWTTLGGSVNESTRIEGVERIFVTFGKLVAPVEFRSRPYEECLCDVAMTHYPRYKIDMNLQEGDTIFDKMKTTYDDLRLSSDPINLVADYYRSTLEVGESLWWTGRPVFDNEIDALPMKIRFFSTLSKNIKQQHRINGLALFPCVFGNTSTKYERFAAWLATNHGIISASTRDIFSAGGQRTITVRNREYNRIPRVLIHVHENSAEVALAIGNADESVLKETWSENEIYDDRLGQWIDKVVAFHGQQDYDTRNLMNAVFGR